MDNGWKELNFEFEGTVPMLMHNITLADPLNEHTKEMSKYSGKRKKTEADHLAMAQIEFMASLYLDNDENYIIPSQNIEAMFKEAAAKTSRKVTKKQTMASIMSEDFILTEFKGPKDPEKRFEDKECYDRRAVRVQTARIMRTRPMFNLWKAQGTILYDETEIDKDQVLNMLEIAGKKIGLGDHRPKFGRFNFKEI